MPSKDGHNTSISPNSIVSHKNSEHAFSASKVLTSDHYTQNTIENQNQLSPIISGKSNHSTCASNSSDSNSII